MSNGVQPAESKLDSPRHQHCCSGIRLVTIMVPTCQPTCLNTCLPTCLSIEEFTCKVVTVQPREADSCTVDLPVTYKNADYFLQSSTRILYKTSTQQLCSEAGAREYKTQSGNFIYALPSIQFTKILPVRLQHKKQRETVVESNQGPGLYSKEEQLKYSNHIIFERTKEQIPANTAIEMCVDQDLCGLYRYQEDGSTILP